MSTEMVKMEVTRRYPRGGRHHVPGEEIDVPPYVADAMEEAEPPYGRRIVSGDEGETEGTEEADEASEEPEVELDGTEPALELAEENGFDLRPYAGRGSGPDGRIYKKDAEGWLEQTG